MAKSAATTATELPKYGGISDAAVKKRTGKGWAQWCEFLDRAGAKKMGHAAIAQHLASECKLGNWWSQMVTVGYEQARGLRQKHEMADGFKFTATKTIGMPAAEAFAELADPVRRRRWLPVSDWTVRTQKAPKYFRATWVDGKSWLACQILPKGAGRCLVAMEHSRLADAAAAATMKKWWTDALARLAAGTKVTERVKAKPRVKPRVKVKAKVKAKKPSPAARTARTE